MKEKAHWADPELCQDLGFTNQGPLQNKSFMSKSFNSNLIICVVQLQILKETTLPTLLHPHSRAMAKQLNFLIISFIWVFNFDLFSDFMWGRRDQIRIFHWICPKFYYLSLCISLKLKLGATQIRIPTLCPKGAPKLAACSLLWICVFSIFWPMNIFLTFCHVTCPLKRITKHCFTCCLSLDSHYMLS